MQIPTLHIVDDDQAVRESLRALLESYQFQVQDYSSGAEFVHRCSSGVKGCVILDMHLPAMGGLQILEYLRDGMRCDAPVVVITGAGDRHIRDRAFAAGATSYFEKPVDSAKLIAAVTSLTAQ